MTTTCLPHPSCMPKEMNHDGQSTLARAWDLFATWASQFLHQARARRAAQQQTQALSTMDRAALRDIGAPHWLKQRSQACQNWENYEHFKAMSRLKY